MPLFGHLWAIVAALACITPADPSATVLVPQSGVITPT